ncbi:MAG: NAD(P)-dependent oxidoreductase [Treponema sp.]|nr:NAD(P)-dependent oxidoreductase [Treponema sp.]
MCLKNKKILVTGALGFIGRTLLETLIEQNCGAELYGIDIKEINESNSEFVSKINYENIDIRDEEKVKSYIRKNHFDGIVHLAAVSRVVEAEKDKPNCIKTNYKGTKYIAESAGENPDCWMIFASSREVYGEQEKFPVSENAELLPYNLYGFYKLEGERAVRANVRKNCVLRFSNVYGNEYDIGGRVVPAFVRGAMNGEELVLEGGKQIIDFTYIGDTVSSIIKCMKLLQSGKMTQDTIHILPGVQNKITDLIDILRDMGFNFTVRKNPPRNYDVQQFIGNPEHRKEILGEENFTDLRTGVKKLVEIYQQKC